MRHHAQCAESDRESIDNEEQDLESDDAVDEAVEQLFGEDGVFFDKFGEVVKTRSCRDTISFYIHFVASSQRPPDATGKLARNATSDVPIASVKNPNPNTTPTYPKSGNIHIIAVTLKI